MRSKRGQSAVEYLVTHGWALMVLVLVVTVLYGLGIFNPNRFVAEECVFQPGFSCAELPRMHLSASSAKYQFGTDFTNSLGYDIAITGITIKSTNLQADGTFTCKLLNINGGIIDNSCMTLISKRVRDDGTVENAWPFIMMNGETRQFYLNLKDAGTFTSDKAVGETATIYFTINYRNCNGGTWARSKYPPQGNLAYNYVSRALLYNSCAITPPLGSEHVLSGKIVVKVGREINTETVDG